jgi:hypothetical protein
MHDLFQQGPQGLDAIMAIVVHGFLLFRQLAAGWRMFYHAPKGKQPFSVAVPGQSHLEETPSESPLTPALSPRWERGARYAMLSH